MRWRRRDRFHSSGCSRFVDPSRDGAADSQLTPATGAISASCKRDGNAANPHGSSYPYARLSLLGEGGSHLRPQGNTATRLGRLAQGNYLLVFLDGSAR